MKTITVKPSAGKWHYAINGTIKGTVDGRAGDAIDRICDDMVAQDGDHAAILAAVEADPGDQLWLDLGPTRIDLAVLFGL